MRAALLMTECAWRFRYPGDLASVSQSDAERAIETAERVLAPVVESLPANGVRSRDTGTEACRRGAPHIAKTLGASLQPSGCDHASACLRLEFARFRRPSAPHSCPPRPVNQSPSLDGTPPFPG